MRVVKAYERGELDEGGDLESCAVGQNGCGMSRKEMFMEGEAKVMSLDWTWEDRKGISVGNLVGIWFIYLTFL